MGSQIWLCSGVFDSGVFDQGFVQVSQIGRNSPCPCGSGKKLKRCCGLLKGPQGVDPTRLRQEILRLREEAEAIEHQRRHQQGLGRPIISVEMNGYRIVAVGNKLHWSKKWRTFHDFLFDYIKTVLDPNWGNGELQKPFEDRHPIVQWYHHVCLHQERTIKTPGEVVSATMTGADEAYIGLAYNLYLLAHNARVQELLIKRLKNPASFHGAYFETIVAATFIRAGFDLEFEDESDSTSSHVEFTATSRATKKKYSVEAKARHVMNVLGSTSGTKETARFKINNQIFAALSKAANHERVVFVDANLPEVGNSEDEVWAWLKETQGIIRDCEQRLTIKDEPAPPAYIFVVNFPYHYNVTEQGYRAAVFADGFKIPDFRVDASFISLKEAIESRDRHQDMFHLVETLKHRQIPSTFDGEFPEYAFGRIKNPRIRIGNQYEVITDNGETILGTLTDAIVIESRKEITVALSLPDGRRVMSSEPISDIELEVYRRSPDTFFGIYRRAAKNIDDPIEFYDFLYDTYRHTSKEKLLEFMKAASDIEVMKTWTQDRLAKHYCEHMASRFHAESLERKTKENQK